MPLNLVQHRSGPSVWEEGGSTTAWDVERWLLNTASAALITSGLRNRSFAGALLVVGGGLLAWWASAGMEERHTRGARLRAYMAKGNGRADTVCEASEESFPASDAPSWTPTTGNTGPSGRRSEWH